MVIDSRPILPSAQLDTEIYRLATDYLYSLKVPGLTPQIISSYLEPFGGDVSKPVTMNHLFLRLLGSGQNANMKSGVVGGAIGGVQNLGPVLLEFDPAAVVAKYDLDGDRLLDDIILNLEPRGQIRRTRRSIWPQYCLTILSSAHFLTQFDTVDAFYAWVDFFYRNDEWSVALPLLLSQEIKGFGFALACDFLKELGYTNYAKPDVHLRDIFTALWLCPPDTGDYELFKAIIRVARHVEANPYQVDKLFWLIGSGYFYDHPHIGNGGRIGSHKKDFITRAQAALQL